MGVHVPRPGRTQARILGLVLGALGPALVIVTVVGMNRLSLSNNSVQGPDVTSVTAAPPPPPPKSAPKRPSTPKRTPPRAPPPAALLTAGLSGLDLGLEGFDPSSLAGSVDDLLGEQQAVVMTEETVDQPPRPVRQLPPEYPRTARARNVQGGVTLAVLVDEAGRVADAQVLQSEPPGVFDQAALAAVRTWQFEPASYQGQAVRMRMQLVMPFRLE